MACSGQHSQLDTSGDERAGPAACLHVGRGHPGDGVSELRPWNNPAFRKRKFKTTEAV